MIEIWHSVNGYEGLYEVSNMGRLRSVSRMVRTVPNGVEWKRPIKGIILKNTFTKGGWYFQINLKCGTNRKRFNVHSLVAKAFLIPVNGKHHVNHIDNNPLNNIVTNLEWVTPAENMRHAYRTNRCLNHTPLNIKSANAIRQIYKNRNITQAALGKLYGVKRHVIKGIVRMKTFLPEYHTPND